MAPKLRKVECETEDPWRYMADLPLDHITTMRRVMVLIYHNLNPSLPLTLPSNFSWVYLTRSQRKRVKAMLQESKNNDLLVEMLQWFSAQHMAEDEEIANATETLRRHVVNAVRQPRLYQVEFFKERDKWNKFVGKQDIDMCGLSGLSTTVSRPFEFVTSIGQTPGDTTATQQPAVTSTYNEASSKKCRGKLTPSAVINQHQDPLVISEKQLHASIPFIFLPVEPESFGPKIQRQEPSVLSRIQEEGQAITTVNNCYSIGEDAPTASDTSSGEEVNIFLETVLPGSPKKTRSGTKFATSSQESTRQTMESACRDGNGIAEEFPNKILGSAPHGGNGIIQESPKLIMGSALRWGKGRTAMSRVKSVRISEQKN